MGLSNCDDVLDCSSIITSCENMSLVLFSPCEFVCVSSWQNMVLKTPFRVENYNKSNFEYFPRCLYVHGQILSMP